MKSEMLVVDQRVVNFLTALAQNGEEAGTILGILQNVHKWHEEIIHWQETGEFPFTDTDDNEVGTNEV